MPKAFITQMGLIPSYTPVQPVQRDFSSTNCYLMAQIKPSRVPGETADGLSYQIYITGNSSGLHESILFNPN